MKNLRRILSIGLLFLFLACITINIFPQDIAGKSRFKYRGNTHTHARFSDDNDKNDVPEIAGWYKDAGYNFLCLSEHNDHLEKKKIFCHDELNDPPDFIMLCGNELSNRRHHTALGITKYIGDESSLQDGVSKTIDAGGIPILNHPMDPVTTTAGFISIKGLNHLEIFNGGRREDTRRSEQLWDSILSAPRGRIVYAVASDDNHYSRGNVGKGWIMVDAPALTREGIIESIKNGNFYATTGILISDYKVSGRNISVSSSNCDSIFFIGKGGTILSKVAGKNAQYRVSTNEKYVRINLTGMDGKSAWTQPVFFRK